MEQRYDAVLGVIRDGFTVTEVAQKFGVSRQSVHTWLARYEARVPPRVCASGRSVRVIRVNQVVGRWRTPGILENYLLAKYFSRGHGSN
jgi:hypothetical protein